MTVELILAKTGATALMTLTPLNASVNHRTPEERVKLRWIPAPPIHVPTAPSAVLTGTTRTSPAPAPSGSPAGIATRTSMSASPRHHAETELHAATPTVAMNVCARRASRAGIVWLTLMIVQAHPVSMVELAWIEQPTIPVSVYPVLLARIVRRIKTIVC